MDLQKPYGMEELAAAVASALAQRRATSGAVSP
jgi:hypothetical protein